MLKLHWVDLVIFVVYLLAMLGLGVYFFTKNKSKEDYYVGGRGMSASHIGLSVVATDVGGGFSIGLGGLGFIMGLSGSWMLFTGLLGAWLSAVFLIPKVYPLGKKYQFLSFPQLLAFKYNKKVAMLAGIISFIGYVGFSSSQLLAGAKLASATFPQISMFHAILAMGVIAVVYTVIGGMKAVIYTDTIQWIILMVGLVGIALPIGYVKLGGWEVIQSALPSSFLRLDNVSVAKLFNWAITIVPIWFVGMTLYQRIYACKDQKTAIKAWRIAGFFEWPIMAFMGVLLGMFAKVAMSLGMFEYLGYAADANLDPELGLPLFLRTVLPVGLLGLMMAAYFSAIMSTADSCLMAASGNFLTDILSSFKLTDKKEIRLSQLVTLVIGAAAVWIALQMHSVLDLMLYSYAFMVSGMFVPVVALLVLKKPSPLAAFASMIAGGTCTLVLILSNIKLPWDMDANFFGILLATIVFIILQLKFNLQKKTN